MSKSGIILIIIIVLIAIGFGLSRDGTPSETGPIKIGFIAPLSGDAAVYGEPGRNVVALAVAEINNEGGVNGRLLEVIYEDGKCNGKDATNAAQKLINIDKVKIIIGGFCSSESLAVVPLAEANKVFLLSPGSSSPDLTNVSEFFARTYPSDATQGAVLAEEAFNNRDWKKVAFIQESLDYPLGVYNAFADTFIELGGEIIKEEFPTNTTDFRTMLTKLKAEKPDALFVDSQTPAVSERILQQLSDLDWKPNIIVNDVVAGDADTITNNAVVLEGAIAAEFGVDPENPQFQALLENYQTIYGDELPFQSYGQTEYDAVYLLRDALLEVGEDATKLASWFREVDGWQGASGSVTIGSDGDRTGGHVLKVIKDGIVTEAQ